MPDLVPVGLEFTGRLEGGLAASLDRATAAIESLEATMDRICSAAISRPASNPTHTA